MNELLIDKSSATSASPFNKTTLDDLINKINGNTTGGIAELTTNSSTAITAATIRSRNSDKSVVVRLGDLDWIVTYVSKDTSGNVIATLWLDNNHQEAWGWNGTMGEVGDYSEIQVSDTVGNNVNIGTYCGLVNGGLYSDWSANWYDGYMTVNYPCSMYGTSYIRTDTLNNPQNRKVATRSSSGDTNAAATLDETTWATQKTAIYNKDTKTGHPFALFTVSTYGLTSYIDTPSQMSWMTNRQNPANRIETSYWLNNESTTSNNSNNYSATSGTNGWYVHSTYGTNCYESNAYYSNWQYDYLWLPSMAETGYNSSYDGFWETSQAERSTYTGSNGYTSSSRTTTLNTNNSSDTAYVYSWSRSAGRNSAYYSFHLYPAGFSYDGKNVSYSQAVRPALLLNLTSAASHAEYPKATINLDQQNGSGGDVAVYLWELNTTLPTIKPPRRDGYNFAGYYTAENGGGTKIYNADGTPAISVSTSVENTTLYAKWVDLNITLDNQGATTAGTTSVVATYNAALPEITPPTKTGVVFRGYYTGTYGSGTKVYNAYGTPTIDKSTFTQDTTLYAYYIIGDLLLDSSTANGSAPFNKANLTTLINMIYGASGDLNTQISSLTSSTATTPLTATNLRGNTLYKDSGESITVRLGGLDWIVTYVSNDTSGNLIATLWLDNNHQEAWGWNGTSSTSVSDTVGNNVNIGTYCGLVNGGLYSDWSANWSDRYATVNYPSAMYGTSYIRTDTLNNPQNRNVATRSGGNTNAAATLDETTWATQKTAIYNKDTKTGHPFALFTVSTYGLTSYIDTPSQMSWMTNRQNPANRIETSYWLNNESTTSNNSNNYSATSGTNGWYVYSTYGTNCYESNAYYSNWQYDYLWLPSMAETGYSSSYDGFWETSQAERSTYTGDKDNYQISRATTLNPNSSSDTAYVYSWSRSAYSYDASYSYYLNPAGGSCNPDYVSSSRAVRPALLLNLTSAEAHAAYPPVITFDNQGGAGDTESISVAKGSALSDITVPTISDTNYIFGGYYTSVNGAGAKIYNADGTPAITASIFDSDTTLYAYWKRKVFDTSASTSGVTATFTTKFDYTESTENAKLIITPQAGYVVTALSFDDTNWFAIEYYQAVMYDTGVALSAVYSASTKSNIIAIDFYTLLYDYSNPTTVPVYLKFANQAAYTSLKTPPSGGISGFAVTATYGGAATLLGVDIDSLDETGTITVSADLVRQGYKFVCWQDASGETLSTNQTERFTKADVEGMVITAVFEAETSTNINGSTGN